MTKEEMLSLLNKDLTLEFSACIQYVQHGAVISGPEYEGIQKELLVHSTEELMHATQLSEQIAFLGGVPTVKVGQIQTDAVAETMLKQDLAGEQDAISRYKTRISQAEAMQEYGLRRVLEDILITEEEHARDLQMSLGL